MTLEERVAWLEQRAGKDDEMVKELREAVTATAAMEARHSRAIKDHNEWLVAHDKGMLELREMMRKREEAAVQLDARISALVSAIGAFISRQPAN
ncbi:MAG TPA: hypothetical protein VEF06_11945 [Bryobacteraceae bacterium]|nr:hypothetical protein [Bryobacteraceae bacterium]